MNTQSPPAYVTPSSFDVATMFQGYAEHTAREARMLAHAATYPCNAHRVHEVAAGAWRWARYTEKHLAAADAVRVALTLAVIG